MNILDNQSLNEIFDCIDDIAENHQSNVQEHSEKINETSLELLKPTGENKFEIDVETLYKELSSLIEVGKKALASASYVLETTGDPESISGVSNMDYLYNHFIHRFRRWRRLDMSICLEYPKYLFTGKISVKSVESVEKILSCPVFCFTSRCLTVRAYPAGK